MPRRNGEAEGRTIGADVQEQERQEREEALTQAEVLPITHVKIQERNGVKGVLATADVELSGLFTIRNAKIKEDDYGLTVVMPRTKVSEWGEYKDACFFTNRSLREQFDHAVLKAYEQTLGIQEQEQLGSQEPEMEESGMGGMSM